MTIGNILHEMLEQIRFSKNNKFLTINLENIALHEAQIKLSKFLETASDNDKKEAYNYAHFLLNKWAEEGEIYKYFDNKNKTGFIIQPSESTDMTFSYQYTLDILDECKDIIA